MFREYQMATWAKMYLHAAWHLGVNKGEVQAFAASIASDIASLQKVRSLGFALQQGLHLTIISHLCPKDYLQPNAISYLTQEWNEQGINYTEQTAQAALTTVQMDAVAFLEVVTEHDGQFTHVKRAATPEDISTALSQGAAAALYVYQGAYSGGHFLVLEHEGDEHYQAYLPSSDLVHCGDKATLHSGMWPTLTILSRARLQL